MNLDNLRHSCAHLLAAAIEQLYPAAIKTIGPSIENGFYFDFDNLKISESDFAVIESKMHELASTWQSFIGREVSVLEAQEFYKANPFKLELISEFSSASQNLTIYKSGNYEDLCRGGHCDHPDQELLHFKLLSVAGAYWRGSEKNKMLTRIYGTCFPTHEELTNYLTMLDQAKLRDHKKLGKDLDLFIFSDLVGAGLPLWTPKGTVIREELNDFVWQLRRDKGYQRVTIPHITKKELYEKSGHWSKFSDELFKIETREGHTFAMKPMNCPHHAQIFASRLRSYRELPQRYCETTMVYRDEQSGELSGLSRVRSITQDDAHVFCTADQVEQEVMNVWDIVAAFYSVFDFKLQVRLSTHDPAKMQNYLGTPEIWAKAETQLKNLIAKRGEDFIEGVGDAAMYGPKIDFLSKDSLGRPHQIGTIQLDFNQPKGLGLSFINSTNSEEQPVMIHCAIMGSIERLLSILIEHYAGAFPTWLSPVQVVVLPISDKQIEYATKVVTELKAANVRVELNDKNEPLNARIRDAKLQKIPYILVLGDREAAASSVSVSNRDSKTPSAVDLSTFVTNITKEIATRALS